MFCSINNPYNTHLQDIRDFVKDKYAHGLDKKRYKVCMYFTNSTVHRFLGENAKIKQTKVGIEYMIMSEITAYPFGFLLYVNPSDTWDYAGTDITEMADYGYDDKADILFPWKLLEVSDYYSESYRSKSEVRQLYGIYDNDEDERK